MEDARALLESLMGSNRDVPLKEAKKKKGQNFKESKACKFYLLGFCPQHEDLFKNTKKGHLQIGECCKVHSDALKEEFEASPEKVEHERQYARDLLKYLQGLTRKVDEIVKRQSTHPPALFEDAEQKSIGDVARRQIELIREDAARLLNEAEELAEAGDIEGSKAKQMIYEQTKERADEYEARSKEPPKEEICEVCGLRPEDGDGVRAFAHNQGRIHVGFVKIRKWIQQLKERIDEIEDQRQKDRDEGRLKEEGDAKAGDRAEGDKQDDREPQKDRDTGDRGEGDDRRRRGDDRRRRGDDPDTPKDDRGYERRGGERRGGGDRGDEYRDDRGYERRERRGGGDREVRDDRGYERRGGDRGYADDRGYDRRGGDRGYARGGDRGRDRGYDDRDGGYGRGRSRSGGRRR